MIIPLGMRTISLQRVPYVSIGIALVCLGVFLLTMPILKEAEANGERLLDLTEYWLERPYLELPEEIRDTYVPEELQAWAAREAKWVEQQAEQMKRVQEAEGHPVFADTLSDHLPTLPNSKERAREQATLNAMSEAFLASMQKQGLNRWGLVPANGFVQRGWLAHIFLHADWLHLFFNLLLFAMVAILLEDAWGRPLFALFFLVGGVAGGVGHYIAASGSTMPLIGASGAIAACLGAFAVRFAKEEVRFLIFPAWLWGRVVHILTMPAWLWGILFFGMELLTFAVVGNSSGVSNMAHVGGFAFGGALALFLLHSGVEARFIAPNVEKAQGGWTRHEGIDKAHAALAMAQRGDARVYLNEAVQAQPDNFEARTLLARLAAEDGDRAGVTFHVGRLLSASVQSNDHETTRMLVEEFWDHLDLSRLRPPVAFGAARAIAGRLPNRAEQLFRHLTGCGGEVGDKAKQALSILEERRRGALRQSAPRRSSSSIPAPQPLVASVVPPGIHQLDSDEACGAHLELEFDPRRKDG